MKKCCWPIVGLCLLVVLAAACNGEGGPRSSPTPTPTAPSRGTPTPTLHTPTPTASPQRGGTLHYAVSGGTSSFDPFTQGDLNTHAFIQPTYNGLLKFDAAGQEILPDLAEAWERVDSTTWMFHIRSSVRFHDGTPLTAKDVAFSIHRAINPLPGTLSLVLPLLTPIEEAEAMDDSTVRVTTSTPWAAALTRLAHPLLRIVPEHVANRSPIPTPPPPRPTPIPIGMRDVVLGSGPFVFEEYDPTAGGRLTRNERYWERGKPYLDSLRLDILPDKRTALAALATRRLDLYLEEASAQDVALVDRSVPGVVAWRWRDPVAGPEVLVNASKSPFHDVRVRKALRLAVDNDAMHRADSNKGSLAWNSPLGLTAWGLSQEELSRRDEHAASLSARQRAARELLQQAGVRSGLQVTVMVADPAQESASGGQPAGLFGSAPSTITSPKAVAKAEVLAESFRALGLDVPPVQKRSPSQFQTDLLLLRYDVAVVDIEFEGYPDPDGLKSFWADRGPRNYTGFRDPELDALLRQQSVVLATGERMEMVQQIQRQILDSYAAFYLPLALPNEESPAVALSQPWVRGFRYDWLGARLGNLRFDEVWLDSPPAR